MQKGSAKKLLLDRKELVNVVHLPKRYYCVWDKAELQEQSSWFYFSFVHLIYSTLCCWLLLGNKNSERRGSSRNLGTFGWIPKKSEVPRLDVALSSLLAELCWGCTERRLVLRSLQKEQIYSLSEKTRKSFISLDINVKEVCYLTQMPLILVKEAST